MWKCHGTAGKEREIVCGCIFECSYSYTALCLELEKSPHGSRYTVSASGVSVSFAFFLVRPRQSFVTINFLIR